MDLDELKAKLENSNEVVYPTGDYDKRERMAEPMHEEKAALHIDSVMPPFSDDEDEDDIEEQEPDYYTCMCCGNVQEKGMSCNKCAGPTTESFY